MDTIAEMYDKLREQQRRLAGVVEDDAEEEVEPQWVVEPAVEIELSELPSAAKTTAAKALGMGWETHAYQTVIHHEPTRFKKDGKTGNKGDIKSEGYEATHYQVIAVDRARKLGFNATWERKSNGKSNLFVDALVSDPLGIPTELFVDYEFTSQHEEYNDGTQYLPKKKLLKQATPFKEWLEDWVAIYATKLEDKNDS